MSEITDPTGAADSATQEGGDAGFELLPSEGNAKAEKFHCPSCAAEMRFDADVGKLKCDYCDSTVEVGTQEGHRTIVEYDLEKGLASSEHGYGTEVKRTVCSDCGAAVSFSDVATAARCDFCGSHQVLEQADNRRLIRPGSLVPFAVDRDRAGSLFSGWLEKLWFRPNDLKGRAKVHDIAGVYVPYWTFDSRVDSDWTAQAGYYYWETESYTTRDSDGNTVQRTRRVRKTRWEPAWGSRVDHYDDVLICASRGLPDKLAVKLRTFDTSFLVPYDPRFLAGWKAEEYAVELNDGWHRAVDVIERSQKARCSRDVPGDTQRFLDVTNRFSLSTFKHALLPIWISSYRYKEKVYRFLINGQTGEIAGKAPLSWFKIIALIVVIIGIIVGGLLAAQAMQS